MYFFFLQFNKKLQSYMFYVLLNACFCAKDSIKLFWVHKRILFWKFLIRGHGNMFFQLVLQVELVTEAALS